MIVHLFVIDCYYSIFDVAPMCTVLGSTCCITYLLLVVVFILLGDNYCNLNDFLSFLKFILQFQMNLCIFKFVRNVTILKLKLMNSIVLASVCGT